MNVSNLTVNLAMRSRNSSKPKLMLGSESAIEGAFAEDRGGRIVLVESDGSNIVDILDYNKIVILCWWELNGDSFVSGCLELHS